MRSPLLFLFLCLAACAPEQNPIKLSAGAAEAPINPPIGSFIAGADRNRTFTEVRDSLFVKAVVLHDGTNSLAFVTVDCIGLLNPEVERIQQLVAQRTNIPASQVIVSSTHTHAGPDVVGIWGPNPMHSGVDTTYISYLVNTAAEQVAHADQSRKPAELYAGAKDYHGNWFTNICLEELDPSVSLLYLKDEAGATIATLTNFACHPTFLDTHFSVVSADYPGAFYKRMRTQLKGGIHLFLQGAIGGWVQPKDGLTKLSHFNNEQPLPFQLADYYGQDLADSVVRMVLSVERIEKPEIKFTSERFKLPVDNMNWKILSQAGVIHRVVTDSVSTTMAWFSIGNAQFATHPGETSPWLGLQTKALMDSGPKFVLGLSQDALGYILKPEFFTDSTRLHSDYLTSMSLGPNTTPLLLEKLKELRSRQVQN